MASNGAISRVLKKDLTPAELAARLAPGLCALAHFAPGDELRRKDNHYTDMYLIVDGLVDVMLAPESEPIKVGPGSPIGEIGFLRGCRSTATVVAREASNLRHHA